MSADRKLAARFAADVLKDVPAEEVLRRSREIECETSGHLYEVVVTGGENKPSFVLCDRCGKSWEMA